MPHLLEQWDSEANEQLTPHDVSFGSSSRKIWWTCKEGHHWQSDVVSRTRGGSGCPFCAGKRVLVGVNDLATRNPALVAEWHPVKNGSLSPQRVFPGSHKVVWWQCEKGHEWRASIKARAFGTNCPVCANKTLIVGTNDLATTHPNIAAEWHPTQNGPLTPKDLVMGSHKKVWWQCEKGHSWQARVYSRAGHGTNCPVCSSRTVIAGENDFESYRPHIARHWDFKKNHPLKPDEVSRFCNRRVWWKCDLGHSYRCSVAELSSGRSGCPYCSGHKVLAGFNDLATKVPEVAEQWYAPLNAPLTPEMVTPGSTKKVWWECKAGHVWKAVIYSRTGKRRCGCPVCAGKYKEKDLRRDNLYSFDPD